MYFEAISITLSSCFVHFDTKMLLNAGGMKNNITVGTYIDLARLVRENISFIMSNSENVHNINL